MDLLNFTDEDVNEEIRLCGEFLREATIFYVETDGILADDFIDDVLRLGERLSALHSVFPNNELIRTMCIKQYRLLQSVRDIDPCSPSMPEFHVASLGNSFVSIPTVSSYHDDSVHQSYLYDDQDTESMTSSYTDDDFSEVSWSDDMWSDFESDYASPLIISDPVVPPQSSSESVLPVELFVAASPVVSEFGDVIAEDSLVSVPSDFSFSSGIRESEILLSSNDDPRTEGIITSNLRESSVSLFSDAEIAGESNLDDSSLDSLIISPPPLFMTSDVFIPISFGLSDITEFSRAFSFDDNRISVLTTTESEPLKSAGSSSTMFDDIIKTKDDYKIATGESKTYAHWVKSDKISFSFPMMALFSPTVLFESTFRLNALLLSSSPLPRSTLLSDQCDLFLIEYGRIMWLFYMVRSGHVWYLLSSQVWKARRKWDRFLGGGWLSFIDFSHPRPLDLIFLFMVMGIELFEFL